MRNNYQPGITSSSGSPQISTKTGTGVFVLENPEAKLYIEVTNLSGSERQSLNMFTSSDNAKWLFPKSIFSVNGE